MLTVEQALNFIEQTVQPAHPARVRLHESLNSVLAEAVTSTTDSPPFDKATMDGFAIQIEGPVPAGQQVFQVIGETFAGQIPTIEIRAGEALRIMTGAPIPRGANAIVQVEWTETNDETREVTVQLPRPIRPGMNILPQGESMRSGEVILPSGSIIRAQEIALLAETGHATPLVRVPPTVGILATGDELVELEQVPAAGQIRNSNAIMLMAQVRQAGGVPHLLGIARDHREDLRKKIQAGLQFDFLCISAGVSAGDADLVPSELQAAGVEQVFHKVAMKPGKPVWFGVLRNAGLKTEPSAGTSAETSCYEETQTHVQEAAENPARFVFGLPGNPVSSMVCFELFVRTALRRHMGIDPARPTLLQASLQGDWKHRGDRTTWFPARITLNAGEVRVRPVSWKGSADIRSTTEANGSLLTPAGETDWSDGQCVQVLPWGGSFSER